MTSIHDVAALAKVSIKTVSRVVNKAPNVSDALRDRVQAAIAQLNGSVFQGSVIQVSQPHCPPLVKSRSPGTAFFLIYFMRSTS